MTHTLKAKLFRISSISFLMKSAKTQKVKMMLWWNANFSNLQFFEPPDNLNHKWFPSQTHTLSFCPLFLKFSDFSNQLSFPH